MTPTSAPAATLERVGHVAVITLNRPHARNAVNLEMSTLVGEAIDELSAHPELRVGVLTGAGPVFCAGADLKAMMSNPPPDDEYAHNYLEDADLAWRALLRGWRSVAVPGARARHVYSATAGQGSAFKRRLLGRNRLRTIIRCMPAPVLRRCLPAILGYDVLTAIYGALTRRPEVLGGRVAALRELPSLLQQRRAIQARATVAADTIFDWLEPVSSPWATLREQRRLDAILRERGDTRQET